MAAFMAPKHFVGRASLREVERTDDADDNDELDRLAAPEYRFSRVSGRSEAGDPDAWAPGVPQSEALLQAQLAQELMQAANVRLAQAAQACSQADRRLQEAEREIAAANERAQQAEMRATAADQKLATVAANLRIPHQQLVAALDAPEPLLPLAAVPGEPGQLRDTSVAAALPKSSFSDDSSSWAAASRADSADSAWGGPHGLGLGPPQGSWDWFTSRDSIRVPSSLRPDEWRPNESPLGPQLNSPSISPPRSPGQPRSERLERLSLGRGASSSDPTHVRLSMRVSLQPEVQRSSQDFAAARQASMRARFTDTIRVKSGSTGALRNLEFPDVEPTGTVQDMRRAAAVLGPQGTPQQAFQAAMQQQQTHAQQPLAQQPLLPRQELLTVPTELQDASISERELSFGGNGELVSPFEQAQDCKGATSAGVPPADPPAAGTCATSPAITSSAAAAAAAAAAGCAATRAAILAADAKIAAASAALAAGGRAGSDNSGSSIAEASGGRRGSGDSGTDLSGEGGGLGDFGGFRSPPVTKRASLSKPPLAKAVLQQQYRASLAEAHTSEVAPQATL